MATGARSISIDIAEVQGDAAWCVQVNHVTPPAVRGQRYKITFSARSDMPTCVQFSYSRNAPPWSAIARQHAVDLGRDWRRLEAVFVAMDDVADCRLHFDLGTAPGVVQFADMYLEAIGPVPCRPVKSYIICASARSGSTLLSDSLARTGVAGLPTEHFLYQDAFRTGEVWRMPNREEAESWRLSPQAYVDRVCQLGMTGNGVFGTKMMWSYLRSSLQMLSKLVPAGCLSDRDVLEWHFPKLQLIHLTRRDKVRQAISLYVAEHSGRWYDYNRASGNAGTGMPFNEPPLNYDFDAILHTYQYLLRHERLWREFFGANAFSVHEICYEDMIASFDAEMSRVFQVLELSAPLRIPTLQSASTRKQSSGVNQRLADLFVADLRTRGEPLPPPYGI